MFELQERRSSRWIPTHPPPLEAPNWPSLWPSDRNLRASSDQRPPTSPAMTTNRALRRGPTSSRCVLSLPRRAACNTASSSFAARGEPSQCNGDTNVVSTASCAPPKRGSPSAKISHAVDPPGLEQPNQSHRASHQESSQFSACPMADTSSCVCRRRMATVTPDSCGTARQH